jgi:type I restriction enzyme S subunit
MKLRKDKWENVKFENIAQCIEKHSKNPVSEGFDKYIGLENIDGNTLKIEGFGNVSDGTTFSKTFLKGDVLFGKRRAYLKKIAVADFNGICSSDILVFRHNNDVLLPELLALYVSSPSFINLAISTSAGSLSPRTKWKDLAVYEIPLPPLEEQKQIAALFQSIETAIEQVEGQEKNLKALWKKLIDGLASAKPAFGNLLKGTELKTVNYCDVTEKLMRKIDPLTYGIERIVAGENLESEDFKIRTWQKIGEGYLGPAFHVFFKAGDILYGSRRTYLRKVSLADFDGVCANTTYVIRANEKILLQDLLKHIMLSERFTQYSIGVSKGSTNPYINWKDLDNFSFQIPAISTQREIVNVLDGLLVIVEQLKQQKTTLKNLKRKLLSEILG